MLSRGGDMTATDELRALLDERGVEWDYAFSGSDTTTFRASGIDLTFTPMRDGLVCSTILTPGQAVEATLGRGTCKVVSSIRHDYEGGYAGMEYEHRLSCGDTVWWSDDAPDYCPWCGAKVVEE